MSASGVVKTGEQISIETDTPHDRFLQVDDLVELNDGRRGRVIGVDLSDEDRELGPMFVVELGDGDTASVRTGGVTVIEESTTEIFRRMAEGCGIAAREVSKQ